MSSQTFHWTPYGRVWETTVQVQLKLENLKLFDPVTQELCRLLPVMIHTQLKLNRCQNSTLVSTCRNELNQPTKQGGGVLLVRVWREKWITELEKNLRKNLTGLVLHRWTPQAGDQGPNREQRHGNLEQKHSKQMKSSSLLHRDPNPMIQSGKRTLEMKTGALALSETEKNP
jgi:hypothetical protein